jgi:hypothetical protein
MSFDIYDIQDIDFKDSGLDNRACFASEDASKNIDYCPFYKRRFGEEVMPNFTVVEFYGKDYRFHCIKNKKNNLSDWFMNFDKGLIEKIKGNENLIECEGITFNKCAYATNGDGKTYFTGLCIPVSATGKGKQGRAFHKKSGTIYVGSPNLYLFEQGDHSMLAANQGRRQKLN